MNHSENPLLTILLGVISLVGFASFLSVLVIMVPEWDLLTVVAISLLMAIWDFWLSARRSTRQWRSPPEPDAVSDRIRQRR